MGTGSDTPILEVDRLQVDFRLRRGMLTAVDDVSFQLNPGECVGLVGESGCGKTTTGLSIMRLLPDSAQIAGGSVRMQGQELATMTEKQMCAVRGNQIGMIFQDPLSSLHPAITVGDQIAEAVRIHRGSSRSSARARALQVLEMVEMPRPAERYVTYAHQLSGGLRQRVMIAMALACEPKLLIADEPTTALDVTIQAQILDLIDRLRAELGMAVLLITHDMGVIAGRADRVLVMYAGRIIETATTAEIFTRMRHPYSEALMASVPKLDQEPSVRLASIPGLPPDLSIEHTGCRFAPRCTHVQADCLEHDPILAQAVGASVGHHAACLHQIAERPPGAATVTERAPSPRESSGDGDRAAALAAAPTLLAIDQVVKQFAVRSGIVIQRRAGVVHAVSDVSFEIRQGETFGLVGESGSGKTTIGRLAVALDRPTSGTIRIEGEPVSELRGSALRRQRRHFQMMFQDPYASLDPRMRVGAILQEPLVIQGVGSRDGRRRLARELLDEVGLPAKAFERYPHEFSGGQRQRIGLARALTLDPRLIVADEPVSALDVSIQAQILNLLKELQVTRTLTYLFVSHDLAVVRYMADTIGVMYLGKLVEVGPAREVYERTAHPYTRALIDTIPVPDVDASRIKRGRHIDGELPSAIDPPSGCRFRTRCPLAQDICATHEPMMQEFGSRHLAACHFPLQIARTPVEADTSQTGPARASL